MSAPAGGRLVSPWWVLTALGLAAAVVVVGLAAAVAESGALAWAWAAMGGAGVALVVTLVVAVALPRSTEPPVSGSGVVTVRAPVAVVVAILLGWALVTVSAGFFGWVMLTDFSRIEAAGPLVVVVLGAVGLLPEAWRLVTGRLSWWQVVLDDDTITYRGYRTRVRVPWSALRGVSVSTQRRRAGVHLTLAGSRPDLVVPWPAFSVHPQVLAQTIDGAWRAHR